MKKLFIFFILLNLFVKSQTNISGVINTNTTWTKNNSPYIITANTVIMPNITLSLQPGVEVRFMSNVQISLRGKLNAIGNSIDSIIFTSNTGTQIWNGIFVDNSTYSPKIKAKYFRGCNTSSLFKISTVNSLNDTLLNFSNSVFSNNNIVFDVNDSPKTFKVNIDSCKFYSRGYYDCQGASNFIIKNSMFYGANSSYGRALYNDSGQSTIIDNCEFSGFTNAALLVDGIVTNSKFYNNNTAICTMGTNDPVLHYNDIQNNQVGIDAWNWITNPTTQITNNKICNTIYNIRKVYTCDTYVQNNCWCAPDSTQISNSMYDFFHASNVGIVYFMPFKTNCNNINQIKKESTEIENFKIFPNPSNGLVKISCEMKNGVIKNTYTKNYKFNVIDDLGNIILTSKIDKPELIIDFSNLTNGVYIIELISDENIQSYQKLIICK